ncbi:MAG: hypothetical protein II998_02740 [Clostridia bacterium]|nr:hypothetical protein [Clostridia bacterium]
MLPLLKSQINIKEKTIKTFGGINTTDNFVTGELEQSENMSSESFPSLCTCNGKTLVFETDRIINGITSFEGWVCTSYSADKSHIWLTFNGTDYEFTQHSTSDDFTQNRKMASLSDCILIIPDNVVFFTNSRSFSKICISEKHTNKTAVSKFKTEAPESSLFDNYKVDHVAYLKHNKVTCRSVEYSYKSDYNFYYSSFDPTLKPGDVITLKGTVSSPYSDDYPEFYTYRRKIAAGMTLKIKSVVCETHDTPAGEITEITELAFDDNSIDTGGFRSIYFESITVERGMPKLENICSFDNRIWATSGREIYASKLSDASEWNDFSADEYGTLPYACFSTLAQTEGDFTAVIPFENRIYAFKENSVHKLYGDKPDEFTLYSERITGVKKNGSDTIDSCADSLIYAGSDAIYLYRDNYPVKISRKLGLYPKVISARATGDKYYALCEDTLGKSIYIFDTEKSIWHKHEAEADSMFLCEYANRVYEAGGGKIYQIEAVNSSEKVKWSFKIKFDDKLFGKKVHGQLLIKYTLAKGASFTVQPIFDDGSKGEICAFYHDETQSGECQSFLTQKRCLQSVLEFKGTGYFTLKSIKLKYYCGSEI